MAKPGLDELLNALQNPNKSDLEVSKETWRRIRNGDSFDELNMEKGELKEFLKEWMGDNPYENI